MSNPTPAPPPDANENRRGVVSTGAQSFGGKKTFLGGAAVVGLLAVAGATLLEGTDPAAPAVVVRAAPGQSKDALQVQTADGGVLMAVTQDGGVRATGNLDVAGTAKVTGTTTTGALSVTGNTTIGGTVNATGRITATGGVNAFANSNLSNVYPFNATNDLGASGQAWRYLYLGTALRDVVGADRVVLGSSSTSLLGPADLGVAQSSLVLDTGALTSPASKIASLRAGGAEKASVSKDGIWAGPGADFSGPVTGTASDGMGLKLSSAGTNAPAFVGLYPNGSAGARGGLVGFDVGAGTLVLKNEGASGGVDVSGGGGNIGLAAGAGAVNVTGSAVNVTGTTNVNAGTLTVASPSAAGATNLELGRTDATAQLDFHGSATTYPDYTFRVQRGSGDNGITSLIHRGTGGFTLQATEAAIWKVRTGGVDRLTISAAGDTTLSGGLTAGGPSVVRGKGATTPLLKLDGQTFLDVNTLDFVSNTTALAQLGFPVASDGTFVLKNTHTLQGDMRFQTGSGTYDFRDTGSGLTTVQAGPFKVKGYTSNGWAELDVPASGRITFMVNGTGRAYVDQDGLRLADDAGLTVGNTLNVGSSTAPGQIGNPYGAGLELLGDGMMALRVVSSALIEVGATVLQTVHIKAGDVWVQTIKGLDGTVRLDPGSGGTILKGGDGDGAGPTSSVAVTTPSLYTNAASKLLTVGNFGSEKFSVGPTGNTTVTGQLIVTGTAGVSASAGPVTTQQITLSEGRVTMTPKIASGLGNCTSTLEGLMWFARPSTGAGGVCVCQRDPANTANFVWYAVTGTGAGTKGTLTTCPNQ